GMPTPAARTGRRPNIGSSAAYRTPTRIDSPACTTEPSTRPVRLNRASSASVARVSAEEPAAARRLIGYHGLPLLTIPKRQATSAIAAPPASPALSPTE